MPTQAEAEKTNTDVDRQSPSEELLGELQTELMRSQHLVANLEDKLRNVLLELPAISEAVVENKDAVVNESPVCWSIRQRLGAAGELNDKLELLVARVHV